MLLWRVRSRSGWWKTGEYQSLGANGDASCQGDWWPCHMWILTGEFESDGPTTERWRLLHSVLCVASSEPNQFILWGWKSSQPKGRPQFSAPDTQSWSPGGIVQATFQWHWRSSLQCFCYEPFFLGAVYFYLLFNVMILVPNPVASSALLTF